MDDLKRAALAARTLEERLRDDPLLNWEPYQKQANYLASDIGELWFIAANRAGKSDVAAAAASSYARFGTMNPLDARGRGSADPVSIWVGSPTLQMSRDIMQPKIFDNGYVPGSQPHAPFIPKHEIAEWTEKKRVLRLKNGSLIGFMAYEQGREAWQGAGKQLLVLDEAPPKDIYNEAVIRVEAGTKLVVRGALTLLPSAQHFVGGAHWLFAEKIKPWQARKHDGSYDIINASIYDNFHLCADVHAPHEPHVGCEIERLESVYPPGSIDRAIRLNGEMLPGMLGALAYTNFDERLHVDPKITPDSVDWRMPLAFCIDVNVEPATATVWQYTRTGLYVCLDEIMLESGSVTDVADEFVRRFPAHGAELQVYGDSMGTHRNAQTAKSDYDLIMSVLNRLPYPAQLCVPRKPPLTRDRINATNYAMLDRNRKVGVVIAGHCRELIEDYQTVQRDRLGNIKKSHDRRDPYYRRTHTSDGAGYMFVYRNPVSARGELPRRQSSRVPAPRYFR